MRLSNIAASNVEATARRLVGELAGLRAVRITFEYEGSQIQPAKSVRVQILAPATEGSIARNFIVRQALDYMQAHCAERLTLGDVADHVYVSQWHLSKLINRQLNQSFFDILARMRVDRAKALLADSSLRIHAVAEQVGYVDVAHFSKSFKRLEGVTPGEYRDSLGAPQRPERRGI